MDMKDLDRAAKNRELLQTIADIRDWQRNFPLEPFGLYTNRFISNIQLTHEVADNILAFIESQCRAELKEMGFET